MNSTAEARRVLEMDAWFVVGLGENPNRDAYWVAKALQDHGRRIVPIHPMSQHVLDEPVHRTIAAAVEEVGPPDVVDLFVNSSRVGPLVDEAIAAGARAVWFQPGVHDAAAEERARTAGLAVITQRCPKIELWRP
jgi:predicted CoA-binding protein